LSDKKRTPSKRIRDLLGAGGAYLLALGGGVLIGPAVAIGFVVVGSLFLAVVGAGTDTVQRYVPVIGRWPFVEDQGFRVITAQLEGSQRQGGQPTTSLSDSKRLGRELTALRSIQTELMANERMINSTLANKRVVSILGVFDFRKWHEYNTALAGSLSLQRVFVTCRTTYASMSTTSDKVNLSYMQPVLDDGLKKLELVRTNIKVALRQIDDALMARGAE
jgi:hypothetical protein